jgi:hypothetical protein
VRIRESDLQKRIELQTEKTLLCDSCIPVFSSLFYVFHLSHASILYDFVAFLPLFDLLKNISESHLSQTSHVSIVIATLLQHLSDST